MKNKIHLLIASFLVLALAGCAELDESGGIGLHPPDWSKPGSSNNHAAVMADEGLPNSAQSCGTCHGADYGKPEDECFVCHASGAQYGHPETGFVGPSGANFHGQAVIDAGGTDGCGNCHAWEVSGGLDFDLGGWAQQPCNTCHAGGRSGHPASPDPWFNSSSPQFHGAAAAGGLITGCTQCHGADYLGGWTGVSCNGCHPAAPIHPSGWVGSNGTPGSHGYLVTTGEFVGWDEVTDCRGCHGADLEGGWAGEDCRPCHSDKYAPGP